MPPAPRALCLGCRNLACKRCRTPTPAPALLRNSGGTPGRWGGPHGCHFTCQWACVCPWAQGRQLPAPARASPSCTPACRAQGLAPCIPHPRGLGDPLVLLCHPSWGLGCRQEGIGCLLGLLGDFAVPQGHRWDRRADPGPTLGSLGGGGGAAGCAVHVVYIFTYSYKYTLIFLISIPCQRSAPVQREVPAGLRRGHAVCWGGGVT